MQSSSFTVYIVDDDFSVRDSLGLLLGLHGYAVSLFADAESFLGAYQEHWAGCILVDIRMPGIDGLALQQRLLDKACPMPVIIMTGHGDVGSARQAFRAHAIDFLEKPIDQTRLMQAIADARTKFFAVRHDKTFAEGLIHRLEALTPREREVMDLVVAGRHNRDIADELGISARTVEVHKARVMSKLDADSVADLVRISLGVRSSSP